MSLVVDHFIYQCLRTGISPQCVKDINTCIHEHKMLKCIFKRFNTFLHKIEGSIDVFCNLNKLLLQ